MAKVIVCKTALRKEKCYSIRQIVFIEEQKVPKELERDGKDDAAIHFLALEGDVPAGTVRLTLIGRNGKLQRLAVLKEFRGKGIAKQIVKALEKEALAQGLEKITMHSQSHAKGFYEKLGYEVSGKEFMEAGIPHVPMEKRLTGKKKYDDYKLTTIF
ncbi:MAG: GNAT family N-acetyltransferase [archaeon]